MQLSALALAAATAVSGIGAGAATTTQQLPLAFLLRSPGSLAAAAFESEPPLISAPLARLVLHQRLSPDPRGAVALRNLLPPGDSIVDDAVSALAAFGKPFPPLFGKSGRKQPRQLVVLVEGTPGGDWQQLRSSLREADRVFAVDGHVPVDENRRIVEEEFLPLGVSGGLDCGLLGGRCWKEKSAVIRYDAGKGTADLEHAIRLLREQAQNGDRETLVLVFPEPSRSAALTSWFGKDPAPLRRRQAEAPMTESGPSAAVRPSIRLADADDADEADEADPGDVTVAVSGGANATLPGRPIPSCFGTRDACTAATGNCSARGQCRNLWGDEVPGKDCWACHCMMSQDGTQYGGNVCQRIDISAQFWLITGTSVVLVSMLTAVVGMLYGVGEQKLPGVIGAGVVVGS